MSSILKNLQKADKAMIDAQERVALGLALKQSAIEAMMGGIGSPKWKEYMSLFADNEEQLLRLTTPQQNDASWLRESRAYMVANAICGADSTTQTSLRVDVDIDDNLDPNADGMIVNPDPNQPAPAGKRVRPFPIPEV